MQTCVTELLLVLVLRLIESKSGASFFKVAYYSFDGVLEHSF